MKQFILSCKRLTNAGTFLLLLLLLAGCATSSNVKPPALVSKWGRFERTFTSAVTYNNPIQDAQLRVALTSPTGEKRTLDGFWDGGQTWRFRFSPDEVGWWTYTTSCSDASNGSLHEQSGSFLCTAAAATTSFARHGPVRVARTGTYLMHEDGTPFFWLGDTAWNGALLSTAEEWDFYILTRKQQRFTAVQWVATQFRAAPDGDIDKQLAFTVNERIAINPKFFQRLDTKIVALDRAGLLSVPVLLWAIAGGSNPKVNPGFALPEDQAILLARYMVARWGAHNVVWILGGDGDYRGPKAERWKRIGRAVFADSPHAPVLLHPGGMHWNLDDFQNEKWLDLIGYQSGHGDDDPTLKWMTSGPPATDWTKEPHRPFINLEPPYEYHIAYQSKTRISPETVRRATYWTLLNAPTAGVTYGGHGVWGWDDGTRPPTDHSDTGVPLPWRQALRMPSAEQMTHLANFFRTIEYWRLRPSPSMIAKQPGDESPRRYIAASRTVEGDLAVIYVPEAPTVSVRSSALPPSPSVNWFDPRTGESPPAVAVVQGDSVEFVTPGKGDWILLMRAGTK